MSEIILAEDAQNKIGVVLAERYTVELTRVKELIDDGEVVPYIHDHKTAGQVGDYIKQINTTAKRLEDIRKAEKEPFLRTGQSIDQLFNGYIKSLSDAKTAAQKPLTKFIQDEAEKERQRAAAEAKRLKDEADEKLRKAAEAEAANRPTIADAQMDAALDAQKLADKADANANSGKLTARAYGATGGSTTGLRKRWVAEIMDLSKIDLETLRPYLKHEHIQQALNAYMANGGRSIQGAIIAEQTSAVVR